MATYSITPLGLGVIDEKFKSTASAPVGARKDLVGCGTKDYLTMSHAANFNYRLGCGEVRPLAAFSHKSLWYNPGVDAATATPRNYQIQLRNYLTLISQNVDGIYTTNTPPLVTPPVAFAQAQVPFELVGSNWIQAYTGDPDNNGTGAFTYTLSIPTIKKVVSCGRIIGYKISGSASMVQFDANTCRAITTFAGSASVTRILKDKITGNDLNYVASSDFDVNFGDSRVDPNTVFNALDGVSGGNFPAQAARALITLEVPGKLYSVGDFS